MATAAASVPAQPPQPQPMAEVPVPAEAALVRPPQRQAKPDELSPDSPVNRMLVELEVAVPVRNFRVCNLLALDPETVVESQWKHDEDLPLSAPGVQLAWTEFEVVETQLAVRLTRLA